VLTYHSKTSLVKNAHMQDTGWCMLEPHK
jgi:hypothetical protein